MKYLDKYECEQLNDGSLLLKLKASPVYSDIFICIKENGEDVSIYDAGSIIKSLKYDYNFKDEEYLAFLKKICDEYSIVKKENVFVLITDKINADIGIKTFLSFIDEISRI